MIEGLFSSRALYRILGLFFDYPGRALNPRLISRYTGTDIKTVLIVVRKLERLEIVRSCRSGKYLHYVLDDRHPFAEELRSIFAKTRRERGDRWAATVCAIWNEMLG